jgi:hypothetical protein
VEKLLIEHGINVEVVKIVVVPVEGGIGSEESFETEKIRASA